MAASHNQTIGRNYWIQADELNTYPLKKPLTITPPNLFSSFTGFEFVCVCVRALHSCDFEVLQPTLYFGYKATVKRKQQHASIITEHLVSFHLIWRNQRNKIWSENIEQNVLSDSTLSAQLAISSNRTKKLQLFIKEYIYNRKEINIVIFVHTFCIGGQKWATIQQDTYVYMVIMNWHTTPKNGATVNYP